MGACSVCWTDLRLLGGSGASDDGTFGTPEEVVHGALAVQAFGGLLQLEGECDEYCSTLVVEVMTHWSLLV